MSEIIRRVSDLIKSEDGEMYWSSEHGRPYNYDTLTRAIFESIRIPTPEMIAAAWELLDAEKKRVGIAKLGPGVGATDIWTAMVDSILKES